MIRARATSADGRPVILLGLTRENIRRLVDLGQPIHVSGESLGISSRVAAINIVFGETADDIYNALREGGAITDETIVYKENGNER